MIPLRRFVLACAGSVLFVPFAAAAQSEEQPDTAAPAAEETPAAQPEGQDAKDEPAEEAKRICRSVKLDMSSRRKTRICRTAEEWRELNNPR